MKGSTEYAELVNFKERMCRGHQVEDVVVGWQPQFHRCTHSLGVWIFAPRERIEDSFLSHFSPSYFFLPKKITEREEKVPRGRRVGLFVL